MKRTPSPKKGNHGNEIPESPGDYETPVDYSIETAGLAHDINNILATISGYAEMIREDLPADSPLKEDANRIISGVIRARLLTEEFLTPGKFLGYGQKETDVAVILSESIDFLVSLKPGNILVETNVPEIRVFVKGDPVKLFRIFLNIIKNAFQSMEKSGGKLSAGLYLPSPEQLQDMLNNIKSSKCQAVNMLKNISEEINFVVIYFRDTGQGIDSSIIDRIYDPYFSQRDKPGGTGLGLTVVRNIVTEMNGEIIVSSRRGEGTEFSVLLPVST